MTWNTPAIDPVKEVTRLIEDHWRPHAESVKVLAVKDVRLAPLIPGFDPNINSCTAIVETDHGNFEYSWWYRKEGATENYLIRGEFLMPLVENLPPDITLDSDRPYRLAALASVNFYAGTIPDAVACGMRSKEWGETLRQRMLAEIPQDRRDLINAARHWPWGVRPEFCEKVRTALKAKVQYGDEVIAGKRSIWVNVDITSLLPDGDHAVSPSDDGSNQQQQSNNIPTWKKPLPGDRRCPRR